MTKQELLDIHQVYTLLNVSNKYIHIYLLVIRLTLMILKDNNDFYNSLCRI